MAVGPRRFRVTSRSASPDRGVQQRPWSSRRMRSSTSATCSRRRLCRFISLRSSCTATTTATCKARASACTACSSSGCAGPAGRPSSKTRAHGLAAVRLRSTIRAYSDAASRCSSRTSTPGQARPPGPRCGAARATPPTPLLPGGGAAAPAPGPPAPKQLRPQVDPREPHEGTLAAAAERCAAGRGGERSCRCRFGP